MVLEKTLESSLDYKEIRLRGIDPELEELKLKLEYFGHLMLSASRETGISGNFVGRIKGAKCPFDLQFLTWDFS